ncbi:GPW/gp25 family protein [Trinickia sp. LjRoot230]|uniref:GPW/gp25 family protein n=1 Tax=Trinickia sp. LjRoot230 TaxID=3342288 RepID=UPI003ED10E2D
MRGMNASTGRSISGLAHLYQSIGQILKTPTGTRIARRSFGSDLIDLIDAPNNATSRVRLYAAVATALMHWEPRFTLTRVQLSADGLMQGQTVIDIEGYTNETGATVSTSVDLATGATK